MYMSHVYKPHYELLIMLMMNVILHYNSCCGFSIVMMKCELSPGV